MPRSKSTGRSPAKKSGKTPARNTTPRKKSKTPSRKASTASARKSPGPKRGRSRSRSRATTPKKSAGRGRTPTKKSPKASPQRQTPKGRPRSRSRSTSAKTPTIGQKAQQVVRTIEHKIASPIESVASKLRSRRDAYERRINNAAGQVSSYASRRAPVVQSYWHRARQCVSNTVRSIPRRFRWANVKRHFKKNWRRYAVVALVGAAGYYSYQNKKQIQGLLNEQYNKIATLLEQQKGSSFSKYFSGWLENETSSTTQVPPTIPPRTVDQHQVPQPQHHATQTGR